MKSRIFSMFLAVVLLTMVAGTVASAQQVNDRFQSEQACIVAMQTGEYNNYNPSYFETHRALRAGERIVSLEERACVNLHIVGKDAWVPQAKGTRYIFAGDKVVAREDCGNSASGIVYVPMAASSSPVQRRFEDRRPAERTIYTVPQGIPDGVPAEPPDHSYGYRRPQAVAPYVSVLAMSSSTAVTNVTNNNTTNTNNITPLAAPTVRPVDNWCNDYRPGWRTLYIGGFVGQQFRCHPGRSIGILLAGAAAVPGIAYATNSLWWARSATSGGNGGNNGNGNGGGNNGGGTDNPDTIYGYPKADWEAGPCSLWAVGGKYYGRRPIPARCF